MLTQLTGTIIQSFLSRYEQDIHDFKVAYISHNFKPLFGTFIYKDPVNKFFFQIQIGIIIMV